MQLTLDLGSPGSQDSVQLVGFLHIERPAKLTDLVTQGCQGVSELNRRLTVVVRV